MLSRRVLIGAAAIGVVTVAGAYVWSGRKNEPLVYAGIIPGVAVGGYDAVAYFNSAAPTPGRAEFTSVHDGATWRFVSEANRKLFAADPKRYAPQYGGYCAYAVAGGGTAGADPKAWRIVDGRLYLNASARVHVKWERDIPGYIKKGDANWPKVLTQ